jgi:hypothetical protein
VTIQQRINQLEQHLDLVHCPAESDPNADCICQDLGEAARELEELTKILSVRPKSRPDRIQH